MLDAHSHSLTRFLLAGLMMLLPVALCGCTVAAAGAAMGAAQSGATIMKRGRVTTVVLAEYEAVLEAVEGARGVLELDIRRVVEQDERVAFFYEEAGGGKMSVHVARRTGTITSIVIDVGSFGRADVSRLMYLQVIDELEDAGAFLEDWRPGVLPAAGG